MKSRLVNSSVFRILEKLITVVTALVLTPILIGYLGAENYGLWILLLATLGWFNLFELGCPTAVQRAQAIAIEGNDIEASNRLYSSSIVLFGSLGLLAVFSLLIVAWFPQLLGIRSANGHTATLILVALALKVLVDFVANAVHGIYSGHLRFDIDAKINTVFSLAKSVAMIVSAMKLGIWGLVWVTLLFDIANQLVKFRIAKRIHPSLAFSTSDVSTSGIMQLVKFSGFVFVYDLAKIINTKSSPLLVSHLFSLNAVAIFTVADRLARQIESAIHSLLGVFQPYFVRQSANDVDMRGKTLAVIDLFCFFSAILYVPLMLLSPSFIDLWLGEGFTQSGLILQILCFAFIAKVVSIPVMDVLIAKSLHHRGSQVVFVGALVNIGLAIALGHEFGLVGVAAAFVCAQLLFEGVFFGFLSSAIAPDLPKHILLKMLKLIAFFVVCYTMNTIFNLLSDSYNWGEFLIAAMGCFSIVCIVSWFGFLSPQLRVQLWSQLNRLLMR